MCSAKSAGGATIGANMNLLRYNVAASLDGYIAGPNGEYDWIPDDPSVDFGALFAQFDRFVMGRKTFETLQAQADASPLRGRSIMLISRTLHGPFDGVEIVADDVVARVRAYVRTAQKDVWLFGGAALFRTLLDAGLVDRVEVALVPLLLGGGIKLVPDGAQQPLKLLETRTSASGIQQLIYQVGRVV
jgi:dihydrofolate reductase